MFIYNCYKRMPMPPLSTVLREGRHGMYGLLLLFNCVRNEIAIVIAIDRIERKVRMVRLLGYR